MLHIAICEDEEVQIQYTKKLLSQWSEQAKCKLQIDSYQNAEQFLFSVENSFDYDVLLLDIQMSEINGMELARRIRNTNKLVQIVFITGLPEYALEGYEVGAVRYLLKPIKEAELYQVMNLLYEECVKKIEDYYILTWKGTTIKVPFSDILYVEANGHYLNLHTEQEDYEWKATLSSVVQTFEEHGFFLLRRGLYVNLSQIVQIGKDSCTLDNDEVLPVSKSRYKELNDAFIQFYRKR